MSREYFIKFCIDNYGFVPSSNNLAVFDEFLRINSYGNKIPSEKLLRSLIESNKMHIPREELIKKADKMLNKKRK